MDHHCVFPLGMLTNFHKPLILINYCKIDRFLILEDVQLCFCPQACVFGHSRVCVYNGGSSK